MGIAGARGQRQSSDYYLDTPTIELQLTQIDRPPRLAPSRPRTFGVVSLWMNRLRVGGAVSDLLTLVVRFGESRPQPLVAASPIPMSKVACRVARPLVQIFRSGHHVKRRRTSHDVGFVYSRERRDEVE